MTEIRDQELHHHATTVDIERERGEDVEVLSRGVGGNGRRGSCTTEWDILTKEQKIVVRCRAREGGESEHTWQHTVYQKIVAMAKKQNKQHGNQQHDWEALKKDYMSSQHVSVRSWIRAHFKIKKGVLVPSYYQRKTK